MSPLLEQFVSETRDLLQSISEQLLEVEKAEDKQATLNELFRIVHTLKGNTGLFEFPDLTRVLHAGEDVMSEAREQTDLWDQTLTDLLLMPWTSSATSVTASKKMTENPYLIAHSPASLKKA